MDELKFFTGLTAVTLAVIGLIIYVGLKLNKAVLKRAPEIALPLNVTLPGTALWASVVGFWLVCLVAGKLRPETSLGAFVRTVDGTAAVLFGSIFFAMIAGAILEKLGYPIARRNNSS